MVINNFSTVNEAVSALKFNGRVLMHTGRSTWSAAGVVDRSRDVDLATLVATLYYVWLKNMTLQPLLPFN